MTYSEQAVVFSCAGEQLLGIVTCPDQAVNTGILIVVGGPQYRVGSHRQFLLLSRALGAAGYPVMRFDYRGMGDSSGELRNFEEVDLDIAAAIDAFIAASPVVERVVIWGLCDAASAALLYWDGTRDPRVGGLVLLNPWVRSEATLARAHIKHYYTQRLLQPEFWRKLLGGQLGMGRAIGGFLNNLRQSRTKTVSGGDQGALPFQERILRGLQAFPDRVLVILSGDDYTAKEFIETTKASPHWQTALGSERVTTQTIAEANHTFSSAAWRTAAEVATLDWLKSMR